MTGSSQPSRRRREDGEIHDGWENKFSRSAFAILTPPRAGTIFFFEMKLDGLDHIALSVRDVERSANWYIEVLGLERQHEGEWNGVPTFVGKGKTGIALFPARDGDSGREPRNGTRLLHFALRADRENFVRAEHELKRRGIAFHFEDHGIAHSIYFPDPDGHQVEITSYEVE